MVKTMFMIEFNTINHRILIDMGGPVEANKPSSPVFQSIVIAYQQVTAFLKVFTVDLRRYGRLESVLSPCPADPVLVRRMSVRRIRPLTTTNFENNTKKLKL